MIHTEQLGADLEAAVSSEPNRVRTDAVSILQLSRTKVRFQ